MEQEVVISANKLTKQFGDFIACLLYTFDAADEDDSVEFDDRRQLKLYT